MSRASAPSASASASSSSSATDATDTHGPHDYFEPHAHEASRHGSEHLIWRDVAHGYRRPNKKPAPDHISLATLVIALKGAKVMVELQDDSRLLGTLTDADHDMNLTLTDVVAERGQPIVREELAELKVDGADVAQVQLPADAPRAWELVKSRLEAIDHGARAFRKRIRKPEPEAGSAAARLQNGERPAPLVSAIVGEADADALYDDLGAVGDVG